MSAEDYVNFDFLDECDEDGDEEMLAYGAVSWNGNRGIPFKTCKFCGAEKLVWEWTKYGWRLFSRDNVLHNCQSQRLTIRGAA